MLKKAQSFLGKTFDLMDTKLDQYIMKAKSDHFDDMSKYSIDEDSSFSASGNTGFLEKKGPIDFNFLYDMSKSSIFTVIGLRRINEIASFAHPQQDKYDAGFVIKKRDKKSKVSAEEDKEMEEISDFINSTGLETGREDIVLNPKNFEEWIRLTIRDRLIYNQVSSERVFKKFKEQDDKPSLHSFYHVPAKSIRYAVRKKDAAGKIKTEVNQALVDNIKFEDESKSSALKERITKLKDKICYVQVSDTLKVLNVFEHDALFLKQGNLNSELDNHGYSQGELELSTNLVNSHVFSETHNRLYFTQGFSNKGILVVKNKMHRKVLERFKQQFRQQMQGTANAFRVPIIAGTEIQWLPLQANLKDMEWKEWMYYLIRMICAAFQISPQEINFDITKEGSSMGDGGGRQQAIVSHFKETGVRPLLRWLEDIVNKEFIKYYNEDYYNKYVFKFVGLSLEDEKSEIDRLVQEVQYYKTINEVRKERDLDEIDDGNIVLNPVYLQMAMAQDPGAEDQGYVDEGEEEYGEKTDEDLAELTRKYLNKSFSLDKVEWYSNGKKR